MSKSAPWSQEEDNFIIDAVQRGLKNRQLVPLFHARFGDVRTRFAIAKRRAFLYEPSPELERQLADYTGLPSEIDEHIELTVVDDVGFVTVAASASIRNPEELFEKSELDPDLWEMVDKAPVRKWDVPMKIDDKPIVVPCYLSLIHI